MFNFTAFRDPNVYKDEASIDRHTGPILSMTITPDHERNGSNRMVTIRLQLGDNNPIISPFVRNGEWPEIPDLPGAVHAGHVPICRGLVTP
jgi:hypothetical protein